MPSTIYHQQILSPIAAYLEHARINLRLTDWQISDDISDGYQASYRVGEVVDYSQLVAFNESIVSLQLTNASLLYVGGSDIQPHLIRLLSAAPNAQLSATNRDICLGFIEYGVATKELVFPGCCQLGDMTVVSKTTVTTTSKGLVFLSSAIIRLSFAKDNH